MEDNVDIQDPEIRKRIMACQLTPGHWIDALKNKAPSLNTKEKLVGGNDPRSGYMTEAEYDKMVGDTDW
jgi:hypothetical protein